MTFLDPKIVPVPGQDSTDNNYLQDVVGNKTDTNAGDSLVAITKITLTDSQETEQHLHNRERWAGLAAVPSGETHRADFNVMTPFVMDAGVNAFGTWLQVLGSNDTPVIAGMTEFDFHRIIISDVETNNTVSRIQIAWGVDGATAFAAGDYTEIMLSPAGATSPQDAHNIICNRILDGTKVWVRCWVAGASTSEIDFYLGLHEYDINP